MDTQNSTDGAVGDIDGGGDLSANPRAFGVAASTGIALGKLDHDGDLDADVSNEGPDQIWRNTRFE